MIDISKKTRLLAWLSAVPFLIVIFLFEILPLIAVATNSAFREDELSFGNYIEILLSKFFMGSFRVSFSISAATALIALVVALPAAVILRRMPGRVQQFVARLLQYWRQFHRLPARLCLCHHAGGQRLVHAASCAASG